MSNLEERFREDRELRNAAYAVLKADLEHVKSSLSTKGVVSRVGSRIGGGAVDVFETAREQASDNRGIIAALIGAILLWLGREPILDAIGLGETDDSEDQATDHVVSDETPLGDNS
ncbi:MAG: hypothetical protein ACX930_01260 [Erythrobacter sp.]